MNYSQSLKPQQFNNLQSTHIPSYGTIRDPNHPNEMRVSGRYGERSIPGSVFLSNNKSLDNIGHKAAYELGKSVQQQGISQPQLINQKNHLNQTNYQQAHHPLPLYTYGQQCQPCGQQGYMLPVYYEEPMRVRQQWQRPLDPNVHQQQWRFVKTQDKGGIIKYVTKDQQMVETVGQSHWTEYYKGKKQTPPPVIIPERETKTCCTPVLFALLGFLALIGLILGLVLLLSAHQSNLPRESYHSNIKYVEPSPGQIIQQIPPVPIAFQQVKITQPQSLTRPTYTQSLTASPTQTVQTQNPTTFVSKLKTEKIAPVSMSYGYQTTQSTNQGVDYNNYYQIRPTTETATSFTSYTNPTNSQKSYSPDYLLPIDVHAPSDHSQTQKKDFRVPPGYKIDQNGMVVPE